METNEHKCIVIVCKKPIYKNGLCEEHWNERKGFMEKVGKIFNKSGDE